MAEDITHVGIRGHWIRPEDKPGENCLEVQVDEYIETTFEHQYMIRRKGEEAAARFVVDAAEKQFQRGSGQGSSEISVSSAGTPDAAEIKISLQ